MIDTGTNTSNSTTPTGGERGLTPNKKIAIAGGAAALGVTLIASLLTGGITGANWTDKEVPGEAVYQSAGQVDLAMASDLSYMNDFTAAAGQDTVTNTFSPYPGSALRRVWTGTAAALQAGTVVLSFGGATFDIQDSMGASVGGIDWNAEFGTQVTVSVDGVAYTDGDTVTPGIQFDLPADVTNAPLVITIDGSYPDTAGNETQGQTVKIVAGDIYLYQAAGDSPVPVPEPVFVRTFASFPDLLPLDGTAVTNSAAFTVSGKFLAGAPVCVTMAGMASTYTGVGAGCAITGEDGVWSVEYSGLMGAPSMTHQLAAVGYENYPTNDQPTVEQNFSVIVS